MIRHKIKNTIKQGIASLALVSSILISGCYKSENNSAGCVPPSPVNICKICHRKSGVEDRIINSELIGEGKDSAISYAMDGGDAAISYSGGEGKDSSVSYFNRLKGGKM